MKSQDDIIGDISNITNLTFDPQNNSTPIDPTPDNPAPSVPGTVVTPPVQTPEPSPSITPEPTDTPTQTLEPTPSITPEPSQTPLPKPTDTPTQAPKKAQKMTVKPGSLELYMGGSTKNLKVSNAKGSVTYKSSAPKIVKVNSKGKVTPVSKGKAYITVKAAGDSTYEAASKKINVTVYGKPAKVKGVKASPAKAKRTLKVSWKKVPSVSGYIIKYSYNKNMKNSETIRVNKGSTTSKTLKKLTSKKYVYIQVQAYKKDGRALIKSSWSTKTKSSGKIK